MVRHDWDLRSNKLGYVLIQCIVNLVDRAVINGRSRRKAVWKCKVRLLCAHYLCSAASASLAPKVLSCWLTMQVGCANIPPFLYGSDSVSAKDANENEQESS